MSTQLEFIMQLYMMNMLQQQQQQQYQLQQQQLLALPTPSPMKQEEMDISSSTVTTATTDTQQYQQLQQQQSQQQEQQLQHLQQQQQQQPLSYLQPQSQSQSQPQHKTRTQLRKNSQTTNTTTTTTTNCSSSSSCSPNSNFSSATTNLYTHLSPLQQLLLGQLAVAAPPPPSNLLLTPTTPNSTMLTAAAVASTPLNLNANANASSALSLAAAAAATYASSSQLPLQQRNVFPPTTFDSSSSITAGNFLQSSTVTSTPTDECNSATISTDASMSASLAATTVEDASSTVGIATDAVDDRLSMQEAIVSTAAQMVTQQHENDGSDVEESNVRLGDDNNDNDGYDDGDDDDDDDDDDVDVDEDDDEDEDEDEDEKPLASLLNSSSGATNSTGNSANSSGVNARNGSKLSHSLNAPTCDNTTNSLDSSSVPYQTPRKQPADSTHFLPQTTLSSQDSSTKLTDMEHCTNVTPTLALANAILTPPSSEQLISNNSSCNLSNAPKCEPAQPCASASASANNNTNTLSASTSIMTLNTVSSLDAFLQNEENLKNLRKFSSYLECENMLCRQEKLREHFHCFDEPCQGKILSKKDDIIRHLKWHKKRKESLLLGFARFTSSDDCESSYGAGCAYCWKQTHYHCVYEDCPKVYVSTSDVQMHANFHRKNSEIVQEGFRRFRAHENCKIEECPFFGKKISHYHCCREGCNHTFKNKADMDKHKTYHLKDYQLTQDGFKKILKTEACPFEGCKFSTVCNHIHCVREGCNFILHSSSQMISHKRKHDRQDGEQAYQHFKLKQEPGAEDSPAAVATTAGTSTHTSTPLSSLSADRFLSRKRGRPPKKIQLPKKNEQDKRIKLESSNEQQLSSNSTLPSTTFSNASLPSTLFPPFMPNFNAATAANAAAVAAQSMQTQDPNAPNMQLTHLMALFQLQNPLFYQNLYMAGMPGNMASLLGGALPGALPNAMFGNMAAFGAASGNIKSEFNDKQQFKE